MADARIIALIQQLYQQTLSGKIKWEKTSHKSAFQTALPTYAIRISSSYGLTEAVYELTIYDKEGDVIESVDTDTSPAFLKGKEADDLSPETHRALVELFGEARRRALDVDQALDSLLATLSSR